MDTSLPPTSSSRFQKHIHTSLRLTSNLNSFYTVIQCRQISFEVFISQINYHCHVFHIIFVLISSLSLPVIIFIINIIIIN